MPFKTLPLRTAHRFSSFIKAPLRTSLRHASSQAEGSSKPRIDRINSRHPRSDNVTDSQLNVKVPRFLHRYTTPLRTAPLTHISSFLILHELTAIAPLFALAATFHYTQWLPPFISEWKWVSDGVEKFGNYFRRKGWLGEIASDGDQSPSKRAKWWGRGEGGVRVVVEFASAYAVTKALLPLRLVLSVWATPWFARVAVIPFMNVFKRVFGRKKTNVPPSTYSAGSKAPGVKTTSPAGGTNAVGGGVAGKG